VSKPKKTAADFPPRDRAQLKAAFCRIMSITGSRDLALYHLNQDLRSGLLGSAKVLILDGTEMLTWFKPSDWEQRTVEAPKLNPEEGVRVEPYEDGDFYVRAVDLDKHYPLAGTPVAPRSDDTESSPPTTPAPEKQKPGIKPLKDWPNQLLAPEIVRIAYDT
jgi:hypothetical protein